jgi:hypothetical protein
MAPGAAREFVGWTDLVVGIDALVRGNAPTRAGASTGQEM